MTPHSSSGWIGVKAGVAAADTGYSVGQLRELLEEKGITAYIPIHPVAKRSRGGCFWSGLVGGVPFRVAPFLLSGLPRGHAWGLDTVIALSLNLVWRRNRARSDSVTLR